MEWVKELAIASPGIAGTVFVVWMFLARLKRQDERDEKLQKLRHEHSERIAKECHAAHDRSTEALQETGRIIGECSAYLKKLNGKSKF